MVEAYLGESKRFKINCTYNIFLYEDAKCYFDELIEYVNKLKIKALYTPAYEIEDDDSYITNEALYLIFEDDSYLKIIYYYNSNLIVSYNYKNIDAPYFNIDDFRRVFSLLDGEILSSVTLACSYEEMIIESCYDITFPKGNKYFTDITFHASFKELCLMPLNDDNLNFYFVNNDNIWMATNEKLTKMYPCRKFNSKENEIISLCSKHSPNYDRIEYLLKNGADVNAYEADKNLEDHSDIDALISYCIGEAQLGDKNCEKIIFDIFVKNGLDVKRFINQILYICHWSCNYDYLEENIKHFISFVEPADICFDFVLDNFETEESFKRCCEEDIRGSIIYSNISNILRTFKTYRDVTPIKNYNKSIDMQIKDIKLLTNTNMIKLRNYQKLITPDFELDIILSNNDTLRIINTNEMYISSYKKEYDNTWAEMIEQDFSNRFYASLYNFLINEQIKKIKIHSKKITSNVEIYTNTKEPHDVYTLYHIPRITLLLTNDKTIKFTVAESVDNLKIELFYKNKPIMSHPEDPD